MLEITSLSQFNKLKAGPLLILDFYATWCPPCKAIAPIFEKLSKQHESNPSITFAKCDVDKVKDVAQICGITAMPTFQFYKSGHKVDEMKGADPNQLQTKLGFYATSLRESAEAAPKASASNGTTSGPVSLRSLIDTNTSRLVNTSNLSSIRNIASPPPAGYAFASATGGSQCLIHVSFTQAVTPSQIKIVVATDSLPNGPSRIQVGTNVPVRITKSPEGVETHDLVMDSLAKAENTQAFNIYSDEYTNGTTELKLKASKFKGVKSLTIRIDANMSGEEKTITKVKEMDIIGIKA